VHSACVTIWLTLRKLVWASRILPQDTPPSTQISAVTVTHPHAERAKTKMAIYKVELRAPARGTIDIWSAEHGGCESALTFPSALSPLSLAATAWPCVAANDCWCCCCFCCCGYKMQNSDWE
jgi:hypothetical protein